MITKEQLRAKYPDMLKKCSIECDDGWNEILDSLCHSIKTIVRHIAYNRELHKEFKNPPSEEELNKQFPVFTVTVSQIKEKFGGLRFYYNLHAPESVWQSNYGNMIRGMVWMAEQMAEKTCEVTGLPGQMMVSEHGWFRTVSPEFIAKSDLKWFTVEEYKKQNPW